jgi:hypothetical protein
MAQPKGCWAKDCSESPLRPISGAGCKYHGPVYCRNPQCNAIVQPRVALKSPPPPLCRQQEGAGACRALTYCVCPQTQTCEDSKLPVLNTSVLCKKCSKTSTVTASLNLVLIGITSESEAKKGIGMVHYIGSQQPSTSVESPKRGELIAQRNQFLVQQKKKRQEELETIKSSKQTQ